VRQRGKEAYKLKLTNKNYKDYNGLESDKQVVGPISAHTFVGWQLGECGDKFKFSCKHHLEKSTLQACTPTFKLSTINGNIKQTSE
jgi:hypothetical protein